MQNLTRDAILLLSALLLAAPAASAQALVDLDAHASASASADARGAMRALDAAKSHARTQADAARAQIEAQASELRAQGEAQADAALAQTQAHAEAGAHASASFGARALAQLQGAIESVKEFASGLFASAQVDVSASGAGAIEG